MEPMKGKWASSRVDLGYTELFCISGGNDDYKTMGGMSVSDFPGDIAERTWQIGLSSLNSRSHHRTRASL